jgi:hypothetical protein
MEIRSNYDIFEWNTAKQFVNVFLSSFSYEPDFYLLL